MGERGHVSAGFQWIAGGNQQPDLVEPQQAQGGAGNMSVAGVCGIEAAAQQADAHAPFIAESGQGRTWPVPVI